MNAGKLIRIILDAHPATQAVYLFGSHGTEYERPESDVDIAVLLPPAVSGSPDPDEWLSLAARLSLAAERPCDLVNLRLVSTVFQFGIVSNGRVLYCADQDALSIFEMLAISFYQKLNEERKEIVEDFIKTGRAYDV